MLEVKPKYQLTRGILVYVPPYKKEYSTTNVRLQIYYSESDPKLKWFQCDNTLSLIFEKTSLIQPNGNIFIGDFDLIKGYYSFKVRILTPAIGELNGSQVIGFTKQPTEPLVIGLPYSIYPPITMR